MTREHAEREFARQHRYLCRKLAQLIDEVSQWNEANPGERPIVISTDVACGAERLVGGKWKQNGSIAKWNKGGEHKTDTGQK